MTGRPGGRTSPAAEFWQAGGDEGDDAGIVLDVGHEDRQAALEDLAAAVGRHATARRIHRRPKGRARAPLSGGR